jgi:hypothetical protein
MDELDGHAISERGAAMQEDAGRYQIDEQQLPFGVAATTAAGPSHDPEPGSVSAPTGVSTSPL